jgi:RND family efflux transporter MFP subunit
MSAMRRSLGGRGSACGRACFAGAVGLGLLLSAACGSHEEADVVPVVAVKVARAELADVRLSVRAPAVVHPRQRANLAARITAPIRELKAREGDRVEAGQILALLDRRDVLAQREDAAAALRQAQQVRDRRTELFAEGAIPEREALASETELDQAKARVELIQAQLRFTELASPFAGVITEQFLYPGDLAKPEAPIFTISDLAVVVARAQVPEAEAGRVEPGQAGVFHPSDPSDGSFEGRVTVVNPAVDPARRTVEARLEIQNPARRIRAGAFGEVEILTGTTPRSVVVPREAVEFASGTRKGAVRVVDDAKIAHRRAVEGGEIFDGKVQITQGLAAGEVVVVEGGYGLPDATEVRLLEDGEP